MQIAIMVPLVSFLAALRILTEAQICNNGEGKIAYEKIISNSFNSHLSQPNPSNYSSSSHEILTRNDLPLKVLEECFQKCQEDKLSRISTCAKFDFLPGKRRLDAHLNAREFGTARSGRRSVRQDASGVKGGSSFVDQLRSSYEPSKCVFYSEANASIDLSELQPNAGSTWHFTEVCLSAQSINRICPNRAYVYERISSFKLDDPNAKEVEATDKSDCENKCLTERMFTCRSASYDSTSKKCYLSQQNRHVSPNHFKTEPNFEYLENMCLKHNEMCKWNVFIIETGKQLEAEFEKSLVPANSMSNCSSHCLESLDKYGFVCRSFMFDEESQNCALYDEDPLEEDGNGNSSGNRKSLIPSKGNLYRVLCSTDDKGKGVLGEEHANGASVDKALDNKTLQCYRHKRLRGRHQVEVEADSFYTCLSSCFHRFASQCGSIEYSHVRQVCRFSGHSVAGPLSAKDDDALIDDETFDYYQFMWMPTQDKFTSGSHSGGSGPLDQMHDRQDSIEVSHSQPGVYGNFIVPIEQTRVPSEPRDHHRGGFAYSYTTEPPRKSPTTRYRDQPSYPAGYTTSDSSRREGHPPVAGQMYGQFPINGPSGHSSVTVHNNGVYQHPQSLGRTPMSGGHQANHMHNRFVGYGVPPYVAHSQGSVSQVPYSAVPAVSSSGSTAGQQSVIQQQPSPVPYGPYGPISPSRPDGSSAGGSGSAVSNCKFDNGNNLVDNSKFRRVGFSARLKSKHIYKVVKADRLEDCERFCQETKDFVCKSFNFRAFFPDNCELSSMDTKKFKLENTDHFEHNTQFDYYERSERKALMMTGNSMDCFEVLQTCSPEGMELKLRTSEGFYGRIYTYGFYDSCFFDGNGASESVLRISKPNGFPRCGTQQVGDAMTNIVVVQFNDYVQTSRDKKYNLTCYISGPGEAVVTSNYLDTKTDGRHPMQIEHLPAQNILTANIVLRILYRGTPTNTIVVGDLLTFRLEARNQYRYNGYHNDIFATNVIAKDPYTGRQVLLIDSRGCPVDLFVFPELHKTPDGALEAEFYAFKIPDSNFLVFQATVKTCKGPCEPVICTDRGRGQSSFPSWGRRKRAIRAFPPKSKPTKSGNSSKLDEEEVHELLQVYLSHEDVPEPTRLERTDEAPNSGKMCVDKFAYYSLSKHDRFGHWPIGWFHSHQQQPQQVPSFSIQRTFSTSPNFMGTAEKRSSPFSGEPIYCDPSILERSRSLQSLTVLDSNRIAT
ncbi:hypothetical protein TYRP_008103 [Tyrophagus putrescentiae]|nr:hypothetical protein TYRP_008103 [Tyrophagus putrescentiae]